MVGSALAAMMFGVMLFDVPVSAVLLRITSDHPRGRIAGAFASINYSTRPAGALIGGALGEWWGRGSPSAPPACSPYWHWFGWSPRSCGEHRRSRTCPM